MTAPTCSCESVCKMPHSSGCRHAKRDSEYVTRQVCLQLEVEAHLANCEFSCGAARILKGSSPQPAKDPHDGDFDDTALF
jgi:hypothetical protein